MGYLFRQPLGPGEGLILRLQLDLCDNEPRVLSKELIDFPNAAIKVDNPADFLNGGPVTQLQELLCIRSGNLVLKLCP